MHVTHCNDWNELLYNVKVEGLGVSRYTTTISTITSSPTKIILKFCAVTHSCCVELIEHLQ